MSHHEPKKISVEPFSHQWIWKSPPRRGVPGHAKLTVLGCMCTALCRWHEEVRCPLFFNVMKCLTLFNTAFKRSACSEFPFSLDFNHVHCMKAVEEKYNHGCMYALSYACACKWRGGRVETFDLHPSCYPKWQECFQVKDHESQVNALSWFSLFTSLLLLLRTIHVLLRGRLSLHGLMLAIQIW